MNKKNKKTVARRPYIKKQVQPLTFGPVPKYLTKTEVAQMLSVTGRYISMLVASGRLNALRLGHKTLRFRPQDVEAFVATGATIKD
jgi:excisionase family DNA binding protein